METRGIAEGMTVRGRDGQKLGKVIECAADGFVVEKGLFFPKDFRARYDQVFEVREGEVYLDQAQLGIAEGAGAEAPRAEPAGRTPAEAGAAMAESREEVRVPLAAEELEAQKRERQAGEVRVHKDVVTEKREIAVPVMREEVHVERVPAEGAPTPGEAAFQEGTVAVPVREEEVEIRKRPVVKEEVRISRNRRQEERRAEAEVRHEEARIDEPQGKSALIDEEGESALADEQREAKRDLEGGEPPLPRTDEPER